MSYGMMLISSEASRRPKPAPTRPTRSSTTRGGKEWPSGNAASPGWASRRRTRLPYWASPQNPRQLAAHRPIPWKRCNFPIQRDGCSRRQSEPVLSATSSAAGSLADMAQAASDFRTRLDGRSAAVALLDMGIIAKAPLHLALLTIGQGSTASVVGEGMPRPISRMTLGIDRLTPQKVQSTVVVTQELITASGVAGQVFLSRQLRVATAQAIDAVLLDQLLENATPARQRANTQTSRRC